MPTGENKITEVPQWHLAGDWFDVCKCNIPCPCDGRETSGSAAEDHLQRLALALVSTLINENSHRRLGLAVPNIAFESAQGHDAQIAERHITILTLTNVPREHPFAVAGGWRLRKGGKSSKQSPSTGVARDKSWFV